MSDDKWFEWYPGMKEIRPDNTLVQYKVTLYANIRAKKEQEIVSTLITLHLGEIICTGHFVDDDDVLFTIIAEKIYLNEQSSLPAITMSEYRHDYDLLILLERTFLECT